MNYTADRFLDGMSKKLAQGLRKAWAAGGQLVSEKVPKEALPAVLILAAWGERIEVQIVDDYEVLLERTRQAFKDNGLHHPDLFFASAICIMAERGQELTVGSFETINIPNLFNEFFNLEERSDEEE